MNLSNFKCIDPSQRVLGGVCAGLAFWLGIPTWIVRVVWAILGLYYGVAVLVYIVFWISLPEWEQTPQGYDRLNYTPNIMKQH